MPWRQDLILLHPWPSLSDKDGHKGLEDANLPKPHASPLIAHQSVGTLNVKAAGTVLSLAPWRECSVPSTQNSQQSLREM